MDCRQLVYPSFCLHTGAGPKWLEPTWGGGNPEVPSTHLSQSWHLCHKRPHCKAPSPFATPQNMASQHRGFPHAWAWVPGVRCCNSPHYHNSGSQRVLCPPRCGWGAPDHDSFPIGLEEKPQSYYLVLSFRAAGHLVLGCTHTVSRSVILNVFNEHFSTQRNLKQKKASADGATDRMLSYRHMGTDSIPDCSTSNPNPC